MQEAKKKEGHILGECFSGSANHQEEAKANAEVKYHFWRTQLKKYGKKIMEMDRSYKYKQYNEVYWKCDLEVQYKMVPK